MEIGQTLKARRKQLQLSQEEVAGKILVSQKSISNWENGKTYPDIENLIRLTRLYDLSLDDLLQEGSDIVKNWEKQKHLASIVFWGSLFASIMVTFILFTQHISGSTELLLDSVLIIQILFLFEIRPSWNQFHKGGKLSKNEGYFIYLAVSILVLLLGWKILKSVLVIVQYIREVHL